MSTRLIFSLRSAILGTALILSVGSIDTVRAHSDDGDDDSGCGSAMGMRGHGGMQGQGHMGMMGHGMGHMGMMGHGMGHMGMTGLMGMDGRWGAQRWLDLSDEQQASIDTITDEQRRAQWDSMGKIMDEQSQLRRLWSARPRDAKAIGDGYGRMFAHMQSAITTVVEAQNRIDEILTAEQREQLHQMQRGRCKGSHGAGMGHGMMD
ncbi:MAG: Spy/CpxP family protein refolding chaperone [Gammaproteobacteria bacterium]|nr:Spy/CpxP family protein refolding chaperone [Gammaproteobacteria bacterium]